MGICLADVQGNFASQTETHDRELENGQKYDGKHHSRRAD